MGLSNITVPGSGTTPWVPAEFSKSTRCRYFAWHDLSAGAHLFLAADDLSQQIVELLIHPTATRERLCSGIYKSIDGDNPLAKLQAALETVEQNSELSRRLKEALRNEVITAISEPEAIDAAEAAGVVTTEEAQRLRDQGCAGDGIDPCRRLRAGRI